MKGTNQRANGTRPSDCRTNEWREERRRREREREREKLDLYQNFSPLMLDRRRRRVRQNRREQRKVVVFPFTLSLYLRPLLFSRTKLHLSRKGAIGIETQPFYRDVWRRCDAGQRGSADELFRGGLVKALNLRSFKRRRNSFVRRPPEGLSIRVTISF